MSSQDYEMDCGCIIDKEYANRCPEHGGNWSGFPDPDDPDEFWIDDVTGERVNARTGERSPK